jgi:hypothetical protein
MTRKKRWRQDSPKDQIRTLVGSVVGEISNHEEFGATRESYKRVFKFLKDIDELVKHFASDSWGEPKPNCSRCSHEKHAPNACPAESYNGYSCHCPG